MSFEGSVIETLIGSFLSVSPSALLYSFLPKVNKLIYILKYIIYFLSFLVHLNNFTNLNVVRL